MSQVTDLVNAETEPATDPPAEPDAPPVEDVPAEPQPGPAGDVPAEPQPGPVEDVPAEPQPGPAGDVPAEPEPEPQAVNAGAIIQLEKELDRHWKKVAQIMDADFAAFVPCPTCEAAGSPLAGMLPITALTQTEEYAQRPDLQACPDCHALGLMLTGSRVEHNVTLPCPKCGGAGYVSTTPAPDQLSPLALVPPAEDPRVTALREAGYTVFPTFTPGA